ncbi:hypothetical protein LIP_0764 [Limnochorda pilosa]|uniref:Haloacid dehalogenase n=1 Tax=Limnochorda pilosa TaxID=1555112 RepID=A0A0K2SHM7_LIMPI|nr:hypothetical protein LIP_0764 [Limnochorda pilosa]
MLLFDLDGTLVRGTRAGERAIDRAFLDLYGRPQATDGIDWRGKPDPRIFAEALEHLGLDPDHANNPVLWARYLRYLREEIARDPGEVVPGVTGFLERLAGNPAFGLALGTGNLAEGARIKLEPHGLNRFFPTGGFGSDSDWRPALIRLGIHRAQDHYGHPFGRVVVVGDTPLDIAAARENAAQVLAVAGGSYTLAELAAHDPDWLFPDFTPVEEILAGLG